MKTWGVSLFSVEINKHPYHYTTIISIYFQLLFKIKFYSEECEKTAVLSYSRANQQKSFVIYVLKTSTLSKEVQPTYLVQCILLVRWQKNAYM